MSQAARVIPFRRDRRPLGRLERLGRDLANLEQSQIDVVRASKAEAERQKAERQEKQQREAPQAKQEGPLSEEQIIGALSTLEQRAFEDFVSRTRHERTRLKHEARERELRKRQREYAPLCDQLIKEVRASGLEPRSSAVLLALVGAAHLDGARWPSRAHLNRATSMCDSTVTKYLRELQGKTCAGLGINPELVQQLAGWLYQFLEYDPRRQTHE
jgi:hypothetical protein